VNVLSVNFQELYERHLCRHSQFGINVVHLASVVGTYLALYGIVYWLVRSEWVLLGIAAPYLVVLAPNVPGRVFLVSVVFMALFFMGFFFMASFALPSLSVWWYLLGVVVFYKIQAWSHKVYSKETDMTYFNKKYQKGFGLFILLSIYELPILLNYLFFGKRDWCA
jgi:hypothetical protein